MVQLSDLFSSKFYSDSDLGCVESSEISHVLIGILNMRDDGSMYLQDNSGTVDVIMSKWSEYNDIIEKVGNLIRVDHYHLVSEIRGPGSEQTDRYVIIHQYHSCAENEKEDMSIVSKLTGVKSKDMSYDAVIILVHHKRFPILCQDKYTFVLTGRLLSHSTESSSTNSNEVVTVTVKNSTLKNFHSIFSGTIVVLYRTGDASCIIHKPKSIETFEGTEMTSS